MVVLNIVPNVNFTKFATVAIVASVIFATMSIFSFAKLGINLGVDFRGGVMMEFNSKTSNDTDVIKKYILKFNKKSYLIRASNNTIVQFCIDNNDNIKKFKKLIYNFNKDISIVRIEFVGAKISKNYLVKFFKSFLFSIFMIMIYLLVRFDFYYTLSIIIILLYNVVFTLFFFILSRYEFNLTSIPAVLTVLGYSINDNVVIFDRIRENSMTKTTFNFDLVNKSLNETLSRTVMTFLTTFISCFALWLYGGELLKSFSSSVAFGISLGCGSSIFISPIVFIYLKKNV